MISSVSFHPFISHFPPSLFVAGVALLFLARRKNQPIYQTAGSFNLSLGLLAAVLADFSGLLSTDLGLRTSVEVEVFRTDDHHGNGHEDHYLIKFMPYHSRFIFRERSHVRHRIF